MDEGDKGSSISGFANDLERSEDKYKSKIYYRDQIQLYPWQEKGRAFCIVFYSLMAVEISTW